MTTARGLPSSTPSICTQQITDRGSGGGTKKKVSMEGWSTKHNRNSRLSRHSRQTRAAVKAQINYASHVR